jgi:hypothetical protein
MYFRDYMVTAVSLVHLRCCSGLAFALEQAGDMPTVAPGAVAGDPVERTASRILGSRNVGRLVHGSSGVACKRVSYMYLSCRQHTVPKMLCSCV